VVARPPHERFAAQVGGVDRAAARERVGLGEHADERLAGQFVLLDAYDS